MRSISTIAWAATLAAATLQAAPARADDRAAAQALFQQAKALMKAGKTAQACKKFKGAAELSQTAGVRLNLSDCYKKLGRTASAYGTADEALALAERAGDAAAARLARQRLAALKPQLSYVTVKVPAAAAVPGLSIRRDAEPLPKAAWGTPVPVDPGKHVVTAEAPGRVAWKQEKTVSGNGALVEFTLPPLEKAQAAAKPAGAAPSASHAVPSAAASAPPADETRASSAGHFPQRTVALVTGGAGVVGLGVGAVFGALMLSRKSAYKKHLDASGQCADADCALLSHKAYTDGNVATVAWIAGGALTAAGAVLWLTAPSDTHQVGVVPQVGVDTAKLSLGGTW